MQPHQFFFRNGIFLWVFLDELDICGKLIASTVLEFSVLGWSVNQDEQIFGKSLIGREKCTEHEGKVCKSQQILNKN